MATNITPMSSSVPYQYQQQKPSQQSPSRLKSGIVGSSIGAAMSGGILLGDKYFPDITHRIIKYANFDTPDAKKIKEPVFAKFSTNTKIKAVAGIALLTGLLGALFCNKKDN